MKKSQYSFFTFTVNEEQDLNGKNDIKRDSVR